LRKFELFGWVKEGVRVPATAVNRQPLDLDPLSSENLAPPLATWRIEMKSDFTLLQITLDLLCCNMHQL